MSIAEFVAWAISALAGTASWYGYRLRQRPDVTDSQSKAAPVLHGAGFALALLSFALATALHYAR
jgi:hypothetical protein